MFDRVLLLSASVGNGHVTAAEALKKAFQIKGLAREIRHEDVLTFTNPLFRRLYSNAYIDLVNSVPEVLGWMYNQMDEPWKAEKRRLFFDKLNTRPLIKLTAIPFCSSTFCRSAIMTKETVPVWPPIVVWTR